MAKKKKKKNTKKAQAAVATARQAEHENAKTYLTPNDMILEALKGDFVGLLKGKCLVRGLLDVTICKQDARTSM